MAPRALAIPAALAALVTAPAVASADATDWFFLQPEVGIAYADVFAFSNGGLIPLPGGGSVSTPTVTEARGVGSYFGGTAGVRLGPVGLGVHTDIARYSNFDVGTLGAQVQLRLPIPIVQPYAQLGLGYAWMGALDYDTYRTCATSNACPAVYGWSLSAGAGLDVWVSDMVTVGAGLDFSVLNLTRGASPTDVTFSQDGDAVGFQLAASARAALRL